MQKAAIAIDSWKLPIFDRHLTKAKFAYTKSQDLHGMLYLYVVTDKLSKLAVVIAEANTEAAATSNHTNQTKH